MKRILGALLASSCAWISMGATARAACTPVTPVPCDECFAVFVMPDTQFYNNLGAQPQGANHLDLVTRYICDQRTSWTEPTTGKQMPILMVIQLGDIVQRGDYTEAVAGPLAEWVRADAAFDNLDACLVPYVVTQGNHDVVGQTYEGVSEGYHTYFGVDRWTSQGYGCNAPDDCDFSAGQWFIGGGDAIATNTRNNVGEGVAGPTAVQPGRHRAALVPAPNGQPFLFLGLEQAFDFPPAAAGFEGVEGDDAAWPQQILSLHPDAATVVFHHSMLWAFDPPDTRLRWGPEIFQSDSISEPPDPATGAELGTVGGMKDVYDRLMEPYPQVRFLFTGHVLWPTRQADYTIERNAAPPVWAFLRNYQNVTFGPIDNGLRYGIGWNVIAVFDPDAEEVRVRSYRIDDLEAYAEPIVNLDHVGEPAPTECFDVDEAGWPERIISWDFRVRHNETPALSPFATGALSLVVLASAWWLLGRRYPRS